jgi:two-component system NarL family response regulator
MRLIIVEDDPLFVESLKRIFQREPEITIAGVFLNAEDALASIEACSPDILLADLGLPGMPGIELIRRAKEMLPEIETMALTVFDNHDTVLSALRAGASSYILKTSTPDELVKAVFDLYQGGAPMSPRIARKVIKEFQTGGIEEQYLLSHREREVIREIENGLIYKEIADKLSISPHTVHAHIKKIYEKLHAKNKQEALISARKKGII